MKSKENDSIEKEKQLILKKFLENAPFDRWSNHNLKQSAKSCGFDEYYVELLFPKKIDSLTEYFHQYINAQLVKEFTQHNLGVSEKIAQLIELKLRLYNQYRKAIPHLMQYNIMPQNLCASQKFLWQTCDQIWYLAGDKSNDYNYYTKRILLGYVYTSSAAYWLSDESDDYINTKNFIKLRIKEVLQIGKIKNSVLGFFKKLVE